jgi:hypothetical protein
VQITLRVLAIHLISLYAFVASATPSQNKTRDPMRSGTIAHLYSPFRTRRPNGTPVTKTVHRTGVTEQVLPSGRLIQRRSELKFQPRDSATGRFGKAVPVDPKQALELETGRARSLDEATR